MKLAYGIDFGTTNSLVSSFDGNSLVSHKNINDKPHPSVVYFPNHTDPPECGHIAFELINSRPTSLASVHSRSIKVHFADPDFTLSVFGEDFFPEDIAGLILRFLSSDIRDRFAGFPVLSDAVFTIPVRFSSFERKRLSRAASSAGISVKTFVHEPLAAFVGHLAREDNLSSINESRRRRSLIVDWGGGTLDICVIEYGSGRLEQLATDCIKDRSGDYFDELLTEYVLNKSAQAHGIDPSRVAIHPQFRGILRADIEQTKIDLSSCDSADLFVPQALRCDGATYDIDLTIDRNEFSLLIASEIKSALDHSMTLLAKSGVDPSQVDKVLLVGGTSRIPAVSETFRQELGLIRVDTSPYADSLISDGAAIIGYHEWLPYYSSDYSLKLSDGSSYPLIDSGSPMQPELSSGSISLVCTDNRNGYASLIIEESRSSRRVSSSILKVGVSKILQDIFKERIFLQYATSEHLTLEFTATSSVAGLRECMEFSDCPFGLRIR
ncbi:MAG: Hsp70 family protein [Cyanobacteriota bacterium]|jgi:molecular chaperone DnaK